MERYIGIIMMLFLLSMISERFADFIKHFIGEQNTLLAVWLKKLFRIGDTLDKGINESLKEDKRYYRILKINILCGTLVAIALHADLFTIMAHLDDPGNALGWGNKPIWWFKEKPAEEGQQFILYFLLGSFLTGLFISFGSKFWHDLLDLLFEVKNLKRKINDERTYNLPQSTKEFDDFISSPESKLSLTAYEQYGAEIEKIKGVISVGPGYMDTDRGRVGCIEVHVADDVAAAKIENRYPVKLSATLTAPVPVNKIVTGVTSIHSGPEGAGMLVANDSIKERLGSVGCIVSRTIPGDEGRYLLSCYHVLNDSKNMTTAVQNRKIVAGEEGKVAIGVYVDGERNETMDAAIALITNPALHCTNDLIMNPQKSRKVYSADAVQGTAVRIYGAYSKLERTGTVHHHAWKEPIEYTETDTFTMNDLIVLTRFSKGKYNPLSMKGDSGSLVIDRNTNEALGIVVGGNESFTYAVKMTEIEKKLKIKLT